MKLLGIVIGILLATSWPSFVRADLKEQLIISINTTSSNYRVEDYCTFYFDNNSVLSSAQVLQKYQTGNFKPLTRANTNFTHNNGTVWLAIEIENFSNKTLYLNFRSVYLRTITVHSFLNGKLIQGSTIGSSLPFETKDFKSGGYIIEIPHSVADGKHFVLCAIKIDDSAPMLVRGEVGTLTSIINNNRLHELISVTIIGILLVMLFYNACLFIVTRDILYFHYCCHLISSFIVVAWFNGFVFEWVWPEYPDYNMFPWPMAVYFITQVIFINKMLQIKPFLPVAYKISLLLQGLFIIILLTSFTYLSLSSVLIFGVAILLPFYYIFLVLSLIKRKEKIVYIFILGWGPMLIMTLLNALMTMGIFHYTEIFGLHGVEICLAWEVVIFSLALGYRFNLIKQQIITVQHENLSIIENQKEFLEKMVTERTEEILTQNELLVRSQNQIKVQNEKLESQNRAYEKLRDLVLRQNQNLESAVNKRTVELANANQELKNNLKKIERFNFIAAHNLRGPVARILGLCMLVEKEETETEKESINYEIVEKLKHSTKELDTIIHDLILILDIQSKNEKNYVRINPEESIQRVLQQFSHEFKNEKLSAEVFCTVDTITVIPEYFDNILNNLFSNSLKYTTSGQENSISLKIEKLEDHIKITYSDKGIGFESSNFEDKIFEPFQKFHANKDGKGLGLFLIKSQINAMGGKIKLWSKPGQGISIDIVLPENQSNQQTKLNYRLNSKTSLL